MKSIGYAVGYAIGLIAIVGALALGGLAAWKLANGLNAQLVIALVTFVGTTVLAIWSFNRTKEKEREARLFPQRAEVYQDVLNVLKEIMGEQYFPAPKDDPDWVIKRLINAKFKMMVWGSQKTLHGFDLLTTFGEDQGDMFAKVAYLFGCIREDLGHTTSAQECVDMVLFLLKNEDKGQAQAVIMNSDFYRLRLCEDFKAKPRTRPIILAAGS